MVRIAIVGGGSTFVVPILHSVGHVREELDEKDAAVDVSLYDIVPERAELMARYGELLSETGQIPLRTEVAKTRDDCVQDADMVLLSISFVNSELFARKISTVSGFGSSGYSEFGPEEIAIAARGFPFMNRLAEDILRLSPKAILLNLVNPTDLLADLVEESTGVRAFGLCVEVEHLRDHLAYYFNYEPEQICLVHAGVNHDGWVLRLTVAGENGYELLHDKILSLPDRPDFHPGNQCMVMLYRLTGYLRSSAYHFGPWRATPFRNLKVRDLFYGQDRREMYFSAVESALANRRPIEERYAKVHPELSLIRYFGTGIAIARIARSIATGKRDVFALQAKNQDAITNFPGDVRVEVPVICDGGRFISMKVGEFPEWLGWTSKQLAIKRKLAADYVLTGDVDLLERSLAAVPQTVVLDDLVAYAETLHRAMMGEKKDWEVLP